MTARRPVAILSMIVGLLAVAGWGLTGSAAAATGPAVSGAPPYIGASLNATPGFGLDSIQWQNCGTGATLASGTSFTPPLSDAGTDLCAVEQGLAAGSTPVGTIGGLPSAAVPSLNAGGAAVQQGQTLTVTHGAWGSGATITDAWEDCDASGAGCQRVASKATGSSYTITRSDVNHTIAVLETATASNGANSSVTTAPTGPATADAPDDSIPPAITGTAQVGHTLTASTGSWSNDPTGYAYSWARCAQSTCTAIPAATKPTYTATAADVGDSLEVRVSASVFSTMGPAYPSAPTDPVTTASGSGGGGPSPGPRGGGPTVRLGHITATMQWSFRYAPAFTQILALAVDDPSFHSTITVGCVGGGCPYTTRHRTLTEPRHCSSRHTRRCRSPKTVNLRSSFTHHRLRVGTVLTITITRRDYVGKYYRFVVRPRRQPMVRISCLAPHSSRPGKGCRSA